MKRNSNIELLRILSMFLIIFAHYANHSNIDTSNLSIGFNRFIIEFGNIGNAGVILFILITGYFGIRNNQKLNVRKLLLLIAEVLFYSLSIYFVFVIIGQIPFSINGLIKATLPISFKEYWFVTAYVVLYIISPYINKLINALSKEEHLKLCGTGFVLFYLLHTLTTCDYYGNPLIQFILIYMIGAFFGKHNIPKYNKAYISCVLSLLLMVVSIIVFDIVGSKVQPLSEHSAYLLNIYSFLLLIFSVSVFIIVINKRESSIKLINNVSKHVLGIYLIHDNPYVRGVLWTTIFKINEYINSSLMFIHLIISILFVFISCLIIDIIRTNTFEKLFIRIYDSLKKDN